MTRQEPATLAVTQQKLNARNRVEIAAWSWEHRMLGQDETVHD